MRDNITALWARTTSEAIMGEKVMEQLSICLDSIEGCVKRNEMHCNINIYVDAVVIKDLNERGFNVEQHDNQRDGSFLYISW